MPSDFSMRLCLVTDRVLCSKKSLESVISDAIRGGVTAVQLREKTCSTREYVEVAKRVKSLLLGCHIPLIINDRLDVALACDADGLHLGQTDLSSRDARRFFGSKKIIGISVSHVNDLESIAHNEVSYLGVSPVFKTDTKKDTDLPWGLDGLRMLKKHSRHPLVAIGGIDISNAQAVLNSGADGIAVISAICSSHEPQNAARMLKSIVDQHFAENR